MNWQVYEITSSNTIHGVMLRGRLRKFSLDNFPFLVENASDKDNCVRFAVQHDDDTKKVIQYLNTRVTDTTVTFVETIMNPVLSKLQVNNEKRYS
jgi:hypothetical protein